jgi:hypothetical protein
MESTDGRGQRAEVWVKGNLLTVCDSLSEPGEKCRPGPLERVRFSYMSAGGMSWEQAAQANRARRKRLEPLRGWTYAGYGRVVSVMPVVIDFGLISMEDPNWTTDESLVGCYVKVAIDRLEISRAPRPDWPEGAR